MVFRYVGSPPCILSTKTLSESCRFNQRVCSRVPRVKLSIHFFYVICAFTYLIVELVLPCCIYGPSSEDHREQWDPM
jgi:hypothetical protein